MKTTTQSDKRLHVFMVAGRFLAFYYPREFGDRREVEEYAKQRGLKPHYYKAAELPSHA